MATNDVVRLGVLGTRRGTAFAEAAEQLPEITVAAFCGQSPERMQVIGGIHPKAKLFTSYEEMLADDGIDAVAVANYADQHVPAVCQALEAGKHVLSEVPATWKVYFEV